MQFPPKLNPLCVGALTLKPDGEKFPGREPGAVYLAAYSHQQDEKLLTVKISDPIVHGLGAPHKFSPIYIQELEYQDHENAVIINMQFGEKYRLDLHNKTVSLIFTPFQQNQESKPDDDMPPMPKR